MPVRAGVLPTVGGQASAAQIPWGWLGYVQVTTAQGSITTAVDLTGLSVTVTVGASRRVRVSWDTHCSASGGGMSVAVKCMEGGTQLQMSEVQVVSDLYGLAVAGSVVLTPTPGAHTYKLQGQGNGGTATLVASGTYPSWLLVEDIGPSS